MAAATIAFHDQNSGTNVPVDGVDIASAPANPASGHSLRQTVAIGDGAGTAAQSAAVDAQGNLHVADSTVSAATTSQVAASTSSVRTLLAAGTNARVGVTIWNQSQGKLYIGFVNTVTAGPSGTASWVVEAGGLFVLPIRYTGALYGIWDETLSGDQANVAAFPS